MHVRVANSPVVFPEGTACQLQHRGAIVTTRGVVTTSEYAAEEIGQEALRLFAEATEGWSDDVLATYATSTLLYGLFITLAKLTLALGPVRPRKMELVGGLAIWEARSSVRREARAWAHRALLRAAIELERVQPPRRGSLPRARWVFLWGLSHQNASMAVLRKECDDAGDDVLDLDIRIGLGPMSMDRALAPEPWRSNTTNLWERRRMPLAEAFARSSVLATRLCAWMRARLGLTLDPSFLLRVVLYEAVLGDSLEHILAEVRPEVFVCPFNSPLGYRAAERAGVRCVELTHTSPEEAITQPRIVRPREIVGLTRDELAWIEAHTGQRCIAVSELDPATEARRERIRNRPREPGARRVVAYFPTYWAEILGSSDESCRQEDGLVREVMTRLPDVDWLIKPHPFDGSGPARFAWAHALPNVKLVDQHVPALDVVERVDAVVHCGSSLSRSLVQLNVPQVEIALERRAMGALGAVGETTVVVRDAAAATEALRAQLQARPSVVAQPPRPAREQILAPLV